MDNYCIKDEYEHRTSNATLEEAPGDYWDETRLLLSRYAQYAVYVLARKLIRQHNLATVLDVGCGLGHKLVELIAPIAKTIGVDQPTCVEAARSLFPNHQFCSVDLEQTPTSTLGKFDLVMSVDVIEHLLDPDRLLTFMKAHCHPQSYLVISTPQRDIRRGPANTKSPKAEHVREWNQDELANYLKSRGLEVVQHEVAAAFRVGVCPYMLKERWRLLRKGISLKYSQVAVCRLA